MTDPSNASNEHLTDDDDDDDDGDGDGDQDGQPEPGEMWVVVVAGGSGQRYGSMKQFDALTDGERVVDRSVAVAASVATGVVVVVPPDRVAAEFDAWSPPAEESRRRILVVGGGATRADSVRAGLAVVPATAAVICVHDAARPLASADLYRRVVAAVGTGAEGVVPGVPVVDTIKVVDPSGRVLHTPARDSLVAVQTPQGFQADVLRQAHADGSDGSDDAVLVEGVGGRVIVIDGEAANLKITKPSDLATVRRHLVEATVHRVHRGVASRTDVVGQPPGSSTPRLGAP